MPKPFYARTEPDLATGAQTLIDTVTPSPATWGLTAPEIAAYTTKATNFATALSTARTMATRTPVAVEAKNIAKKILRDATIDIARTITAVQTVTNAQLIELDLNPRVIPMPRPAPGEPPVMEV